MPPSGVPPTARQRRLGRELRRLREQTDMTATEAGVFLGASQARMSSIEAGRYAVSADRVRALAHHYSCTDQELIEALAAMTGGRTRGWWEEYREILPLHMLDLAELEHHAIAFRIASMLVVPGLLQTTEYARAIFAACEPRFPPPEVEHRVSHRIKRQAVLYGERPHPLTVILHEAALRLGAGGPAVMRAQLEHLMDMSERDDITLLVIPFGAGALPNSGQSIVYIAGALQQLDTVQLDTDHGQELVDAEAKLANYRIILDRMESSALKPNESRSLIHSIAREL
ncbi:helix-turn-helix transcriptional regulator [Streptomyces lunalinharesii]|uniref:Helix-turn-helix transcriptional regulator n=1 Tax=Streptomyces lunalinharesii TaxID=333384 RepID=A0ABN3RHB6_9ACTN